MVSEDGARWCLRTERDDGEDGGFESGTNDIGRKRGRGWISRMG